MRFLPLAPSYEPHLLQHALLLDTRIQPPRPLVQSQSLEHFLHFVYFRNLAGHRGRLKGGLDGAEILFQGQYEQVEVLEQGSGIGAADLDPAGLDLDLRRKVAEHHGVEVLGEVDLERPRPRHRFGEQEPFAVGSSEVVRRVDCFQVAEQGGAGDQVGSADVLDLADGAHEGLGGDALDRENPLEVAPGPAFRDRMPHPLGDLAGPMPPGNGPSHVFCLQRARFEGTLLLADLPIMHVVDAVN
ncbi:hypothetical protein D1Y84_00630 [Acidipila sp. EB88]|nr:hypothetical protein D1Y84_00630 [Acidipila sp. EB88]